ncbi:MAG TPA: adenylate/guanylate cyclase domain-containing protein [Steroidobacteraceae bacterium]|nr:adenylate/guanylate cyclase domain-containing protein [Steroidobacteraceae bacterium]
MNAPPKIDHVTTHSDGDVLRWLTNDTRDERFLDNIFAELCFRLQQAGIPVKRATLHFMILHPQWLGSRMMWTDGMRQAELRRVDYDIREQSEFIDSPANELNDGASEVRENLERDPALSRKHAVYDEMRARGLTDYVAWPMYHTFGKRHMVTFATDRVGGFDDAHIAGLLKVLPALALVSEIRIKNRLARTLLETYVGSHASELILAGATRRGTGTTVRAAIMICDLRDFTRISDNWPRDDVIDLLNGYFDAMSEPIARHGGEILKFIGDGLLAIFPLSEPKACANLLHAVAEARRAMIALNEKNSETGRAPLNYGIGVHVGDVMYGNIGSRTRLDFTVIGPAVNMAARLETLTKQLGRTVLLSRAFADFVEKEFDLERVGEYPVRGFNDPIELFAYHG